MNDVQEATFYDPVVMKECFIASMKQTLHNAPNDAYVRAQLIDILGRRSPALFGSPDALMDLSDLIFKDEILRAWVFDTKFVFFMNVSGGNGMGKLKSLVKDLALAASENMGIDNEVGFLDEAEKAVAVTVQGMSQDLADELPTDSMVKTVLTVNTWMIVILLLFAFIDLSHDVLKSPEELAKSGDSKKTKQVVTS